MYLLQPEGIHQTVKSSNSLINQGEVATWLACNTEAEQVSWLILHFNAWFSHHQTILVCGAHEPEYFPAQTNQPARIQFAHGFLNSALHEISHWCIAGAARRKLPDLGYWYAPDGRSREQQALFEQVEVKPQAIEWLFAKALGRRFRVSLDNLNGDAGDGYRFKDAVYAQVQGYFTGQATLPQDAALFIAHICAVIRPDYALTAHEFDRAELD